MTETEQQQFLQKLAERKANTSFMTFVHHYQAYSDFPLPPLMNLLSIDDSLLTAEGKEALSYLESTKGDGRLTFEQFKWKVMSFLAMPDVLVAPIVKDTTNADIIQLRYFYYESKYILMEFIVSSLNGLHIGNKQLLRNFLEFNLLQCYFINKIKKEASCQSFHHYQKTKIKPGTTRMIKDAIPNDTFCKPIKKRMQVELDNLSDKYSHAYDHRESPRHEGIFRPGLTIESLYFYIQAISSLDVVLWMYYVNFPMLFKPVNIVQKFGFSPPELFVTTAVTSAIEKSMSKDDFLAFTNYAEESEDVNNHMAWYNSMPTLSDEEIWQEYNKPREEGDTIEGCFLKMTATVRAYSELILDVTKMQELPPEYNQAKEDLIVEQFFSYSKWQKIYSSLK